MTPGAILVLVAGALVILALAKYVRMDIVGGIALAVALFWAIQSGALPQAIHRATLPVRAALVLILLGAALLAGLWVYHHVAWPGTFPWRMQRVMVEVGLARRVINGTDEGPRLHRKQRSGHVWHLVWRMPVGVSSAKVEAARGQIEEALDCSIARIWTDSGKLHMRVGRGRVPETHALADGPEVKVHSAGVLRVHLGMSREGSLDTNIGQWPHGIVGGTSGGGKSTLVHSIVYQLATAHSPRDLQMVLIDLKGGLDLSVFDRLPHLLWGEIASDHDQAAAQLTDLVGEQRRRQGQLRGRAVKLADWNAMVPPAERLPHILFVIDEAADLAPKGVSDKEERAIREVCWSALSSLFRMGRASGIHGILATQRPDADVLDGQVRSNCPVKVAFFCAKEYDSYILLGQGNAAAAHLPCRPDGQPLPGRAIFQWGREVPFQAAYIAPDEIARGVEEVRRLYSAPSLRPASQPVVPLRVAVEEK